MDIAPKHSIIDRVIKTANNSKTTNYNLIEQIYMFFNDVESLRKYLVKIYRYKNIYTTEFHHLMYPTLYLSDIIIMCMRAYINTVNNTQLTCSELNILNNMLLNINKITTYYDAIPYNFEYSTDHTTLIDVVNFLEDNSKNKIIDTNRLIPLLIFQIDTATCKPKYINYIDAIINNIMLDLKKREIKIFNKLN